MLSMQACDAIQSSTSEASFITSPWYERISHTLRQNLFQLSVCYCRRGCLTSRYWWWSAIIPMERRVTVRSSTHITSSSKRSILLSSWARICSTGRNTGVPSKICDLLISFLKRLSELTIGRGGTVKLTALASFVTSRKLGVVS